MAVSLDRSEMIDILNNSVALIKFTKVDGSERILKGTLVDKLIPGAFAPVAEEKEKRPVNLNNISCYDVENDGWRSFKIENLIEFDVMISATELEAPTGEFRPGGWA